MSLRAHANYSAKSVNLSIAVVQKCMYKQTDCGISGYCVNYEIQEEKKQLILKTKSGFTFKECCTSLSFKSPKSVLFVFVSKARFLFVFRLFRIDSDLLVSLPTPSETKKTKAIYTEKRTKTGQSLVIVFFVQPRGFTIRRMLLQVLTRSIGFQASKSEFC